MTIAVFIIERKRPSVGCLGNVRKIAKEERIAAYDPVHVGFSGLFLHLIDWILSEQYTIGHRNRSTTDPCLGDEEIVLWAWAKT